jgi:alpha-tubulin suppressor-like RCC1 family protein
MIRDSVRSIALLAGILLLGCRDGTGPSIQLLSQGQIIAGNNHSCFLNLDGRAWCWGWGALGQMGNGDTVTRNLSPVAVDGPVRFVQITAAQNHTCGLDVHGAAFCWGAEVFGELGTGNTDGFALRPVPVQGGHAFLEITAGDGGYTCAITVSSEAYCWGLGTAGQLGTENTQDEALPMAVSTSARFSQISAGLIVTCGVAGGGQAYCWGDNTYGQLGTGSVGGFSDKPELVSGPTRFLWVSVGHFVVCGVSIERDAFCWGAGSFGRLGSGQSGEEPTPSPTLVVNGLKYKRLTVGAQHTCAVTIDDQAFCWGLNTYGKLGEDIGPSSPEPISVSGGHSFIQAGAGGNHSCGLTPRNEVYCWGQNFIGQLGVPSQQRPTFTPRRVIF